MISKSHSSLFDRQLENCCCIFIVFVTLVEKAIFVYPWLNTILMKTDKYEWTNAIRCRQKTVLIISSNSSMASVGVSRWRPWAGNVTSRFASDEFNLCRQSKNVKNNAGCYISQRRYWTILLCACIVRGAHKTLNIYNTMQSRLFQAKPIWDKKKESTVKKYIHKNIHTVKSSCTQQQNYTPIV